ncbi:tripartite tricarboxylate transporter substrate binding protein [Xylophilus sp. Kf1]|nr:tripartite tricarboxylate transporter substrate binding protein [Xylophilus sp. Kf1]
MHRCRMQSHETHRPPPFAGARRRTLLRTAALAGVGAWTLASQAQAPAPYPARLTKMIIPFPAGGATDYAGRAIGSALAEQWHQPMVFDNRVGAGSTIGTELGARSPADGYTLTMGIPAGVTIAPHIYPRLGYDPLVDLLPVAGFATSPLVVVVPLDSPFKTFPELVAHARAHPGELSYASNGSGSLPHLTTEWFLSMARVKMTHVPYRGSAQALPDLIAGRTHLMIDIIVSALPLIEGGKLRVLAVTGAAPTSRLPGVPTVASFGYPGFAAEQWYGLFAPKGTPEAVVRKVEADVATVSANPRLRAQMWQRGAEIRYLPAAALAAEVRADSGRWAVIAKATGARAE